MDIILLERIEKLGSIGDVVTVKDGYARNFLLPQKKALRANEANRKVFEANREKIEADNAARRGEAEQHAGNVDGKSVVLIRASSNAGQLYGSVSVRDIVDALNADGAGLSKSMIVLERPIKTIGVFDVKVALHPEVAVTVKVNVARSPDEAEQQAAIAQVDQVALGARPAGNEQRNRQRRVVDDVVAALADLGGKHLLAVQVKAYGVVLAVCIIARRQQQLGAHRLQHQLRGELRGGQCIQEARAHASHLVGGQLRDLRGAHAAHIAHFKGVELGNSHGLKLRVGQIEHL